MTETTPTFSPASIRQLAIIAIPEGFLFIDTDHEDAKPIVLPLKSTIDFPDAFDRFVSESGLADQPSMRVNVSEHSNRFMVMPAGLGKPEQVQELFNAAFMETVPGELYQFPLSDSKQVFVCELQKNRLEAFSKTFPHLHIYNPTHLLTEWTLQQAKTGNESVLLAYSFGKNLHIAAAKPGKLLFSNAFVAKNTKEATYYYLRVVEQLQLDPLTLYTFVCSPHNQAHPLKEALSPYLSRIDQLVYTGIPVAPVSSFQL
jgi:hypothetical protein